MSEYRAKEPGSDKWIAPKTSSGYSSNQADARWFDGYETLMSLLRNDKRYKGISFSELTLHYKEQKT